MQDCNNLWDEVIECDTLAEAEEYFGEVDRYDRWRGPFRWIAMEFTHFLMPFLPIPEPHLRRIGDLEAPDEGPSRSSRGDGTNPDGSHQQDDPNAAFICMPVQRHDGWELRHAGFESRTEGEEHPPNVTDREMFNEVNAEVRRHLKSRGISRFLVPIRLRKVDYYEVSNFSMV
jgi:hypothetical protein